MNQILSGTGNLWLAESGLGENQIPFYAGSGKPVHPLLQWLVIYSNGLKNSIIYCGFKEEPEEKGIAVMSGRPF